METIAVALLMAFAGSTASSAGHQAWQSLRELVLRRSAEAGEAADGRRELEALDEEPDSEERARALSDALAARAGRDAEFARLLQAWHDREVAEAGGCERTGGTGAGDVTSTVSGTVHGTVVMVRDVNGDINIR